MGDKARHSAKEQWGKLISLSLLPMDKAKTMIQMVCSIVALPANSATDRLEIAINFFVNLNKASKAWLLAVPANLMPIAKAAVKRYILKIQFVVVNYKKK